MAEPTIEVVIAANIAALEKGLAASQKAIKELNRVAGDAKGLEDLEHALEDSLIAAKKLEKELGAVEKKLGNPSFLERAPDAVVEKSKGDANRLREKRDRLEAALRSL